MKDLAESARISLAVSDHSIFNNEIMSDEFREDILSRDPCLVCGLPHAKCPAHQDKSRYSSCIEQEIKTKGVTKCQL